MPPSTWTEVFSFIASQVSSSDIFGGLLLQSASPHDIDQREMFSLYVFPGNGQHRKVSFVPIMNYIIWDFLIL